VLGHRHQIWQRRVQEKSSTKPAQGLRGETRGEPAGFNDVAHLARPKKINDQIQAGNRRLWDGQ